MWRSMNRRYAGTYSNGKLGRVQLIAQQQELTLAKLIMSINGELIIDEQIAHGDLSLDDFAHQAVYVFAPTQFEESDRPKKRQKPSNAAKAVRDEDYTYPRLSSGKESSEYSTGRQNAFHHAWSNVDSSISPILNRFDLKAVKELNKFVRDARPDAADGSEQATNLKLALKAIIRGVIVRAEGVDGYHTFFNDHKKSVPLNYDLELLHRFVKAKGFQRIVISFTDSEAFEINLLAELLSVLRAWEDRIPFVILFQVATSADVFEARLPSSTVQMLYGKKFQPQSHNNSFQDMFRTMCLSDTTLVWFGTDATKALLEQSKEQTTTPESLALSFKVLDQLLPPIGSANLFKPANMEEMERLSESIRITASFRCYTEEKLNARDAKTARRLLEDDHFLLVEASRAIQTGRAAMLSFCKALSGFEKLFNKVHTSKSRPLFTDLYLAALAGNFTESLAYRELMLFLKKLPSHVLLELLLELDWPESRLNLELENLADDLQDLINNSDSPTGVIRSAHDLSSSTHTTVSHNDNKISLSSAPKMATDIESKYTNIVNRYHDHITSYFSEALQNVGDLFMSEVFTYTGKTPLSSAFSPRPRFAIERALSLPSDYLGCECCQGIRDDEVRASQPPTAILWRLWCEAGALVNVRDLWEAFWNVLKSGDHATNDATNEDDESHEQEGDAREGAMNERLALTLFYRSMAELRMLGFVRQTKKKIDCVAKSAWKGL
ncbi:putative origin recognition complex subunit [Phaeomoniella chlamydospora]|uniref:Putative origin recognition complex subunit n=1 Tax=Phaeomoniella chlamydospora TaxID=158046 RepID=A0A0G2F2N3_PHACM|nr:putative origin recognition complex subunit [Phaeomoniella chlamydospora]